MTSEAVTQYILESFAGVQVDTSTPDTFFFVDPTKMIPFATIVTRDNDYDNVSHLDRPGVYRLNIGVGKDSFLGLFGSPLAEDFNAEHDFAALDTLMPNPSYGKMFWVSVLNPEAETFEAVKALLATAYEADVRKHAKRAEQRGE